MQQAESFRELERIGRMRQSMIDTADQFCGQPARSVRDEAGEYFVNGESAGGRTSAALQHRSPITDHRSPE